MSGPVIRRLLLILLCLSVASETPAQKRKKKEEEPKTQVLEIPPDPPEAIAAETARLSFQLSPISAKGLLSQQVRDALKAVIHDSHGAQIMKLRAFVAGSGDLRRIQQIVTEEFTDQKRPLPVITTVQAGALPLVGAQVVIEATSVDRRPVNPSGIGFFSGVPAPDAGAAIAELRKNVDAAGVVAGDVLRVTCFLDSVEHTGQARSATAAAFPTALADFVQMQRLAVEPSSACEAVARLAKPPKSEIEVSPQAALVSSPKIILTTAKLVFRDQNSDIRLALQRLSKTLEPLRTAPRDTFWTGVYALTRPRAAQIKTIESEFFEISRPLAGTSLLVEGLPSTDASAEIEWMAAGK